VVNIDLDQLVRKLGGRFKMVSLIQRRMRELQRGRAPLVEPRASLLETAVEEARSGRIWLVTGEEAEDLRKVRAAEAVAEAPPPAPLQVQAPAPQSTRELEADV